MFCPYCNKEFQSSDNLCPNCHREGVPSEGGERLQGTLQSGPAEGVPPVFREFVPNRMGLSITALVISILSCCYSFFLIIPPLLTLVLAIVAVSYSGQVDRKTTLGDNTGAISSSKTAKTLSIISILINVLILVAAIILFLTGVLESLRPWLDEIISSIPGI